MPQQRGQAGSYPFVARISSDATALLYSTCLGGSTNGSAHAIAIDVSGNAYVAGNTSSVDFPYTTGVAQTACSGVCDDAFVAKINPQGSGFVFSTFLGGSDHDIAYGIKVDSAGNSYVTGQTLSSDFPHTSDAAQALCDQTTARCNGDAFLTELNATGSSVVYSTFLGGSAEDAGAAVALDSAGNVYVTGSTLSANFPVSANPLQKNCGANCMRASANDPIPYDAFVGKLGSGSTQTGTPVASVSPSSLSFGNQAARSASNSQSITLTNSGTAPLAVLAISITGANSSDFKQTNTCVATLAAGSSCGISVTFTPAAAGSRSATVQISDSASGSPQTVALSGTGTAGLGLAIAPGSSSTATITAGSTATYMLTIGGAGFSGTATLSCSAAPQKSSCSVPASVTVSASTPATVQVSVTTTGPGIAELQRPLTAPLALGTSVFALLFLPRRFRHKTIQRTLGVIAMAATVQALSGCGGLASLIGVPKPTPGTPAGTYYPTVTASSGSLTESTQLTLNVQ